MLTIKVFLGILLAGCVGTQLAHAQQAPLPTAEPDRRRFYAGLQLAQGNYELHYETVLIPTVAQVASNFVVGFYLTNRLAIQTGYGRRSSYVDGPGGVGRLPSGHLRESFFRNVSTDYLLPVTLRYALSRRRPRLRADVLFGLAYVHSSFDTEGHDEIDGVPVPGSYKSSSGRGGQLCASLGLSGRWVFNRHFEAYADYTINRNLKSAPEYLHREATGNTLGLTRSSSLGLRYRFNLRKPVASSAS